MTTLRNAVQEFIADYDCGGCGHFAAYAERFRKLLAQDMSPHQHAVDDWRLHGGPGETRSAQTSCDIAEDGVCEVIDCCRNRSQILEALEIGYESAQAEAAQYHAAMAGYRPERHAEMDADVAKIAAAITALRDALEQEEPEPRWLTKALMADYIDMIAEAIENDSSETLRHKAHWMRRDGEV